MVAGAAIYNEEIERKRIVSLEQIKGKKKMIEEKKKKKKLTHIDEELVEQRKSLKIKETTKTIVEFIEQTPIVEQTQTIKKVGKASKPKPKKKSKRLK